MSPVVRFKRLVLRRIGAIRCGGRRGHAFAVVAFRGRMFLRCDCGAETEGFHIYTPLKGGR